MTNPLIAPKEDSTEWYTGIDIAESINDLVRSIESGDWVDIGLGVADTGLTALSWVVDPFGSVASNYVAFVLEHAGPLRKWLDELAGDADAVTAQARTWRNIAAATAEVGSDYAREVNADTAGWTGTAANRYRGNGTEIATLIGAGSAAASGLGSAVEMAGMIVGTVRLTVRNLIAECTGRLAAWAAEALTGVGVLAIPAQATAAVAKWAARIAALVKRLVATLRNLVPLLRRLGELLRRLRKRIDDLRNRGNKQQPDKPKRPDTGGGHTQPSRTPDPNAKPDGTPARIRDNDDRDTKRSLQRENESAAILARKGYAVTQKPPPVPGGKKPDYRIEGKIFDNYAPETGNPRNIASVIKDKVVSGQADRIVLNLKDSPVDLDAMRKQLRDWPIEGLKEILVIERNGNLINFYP